MWRTPISENRRDAHTAAFIGVPDEVMAVPSLVSRSTLRLKAELAARFGADRWRIALGWQSGPLTGGTPTHERDGGVMYGGVSFGF